MAQFCECGSLIINEKCTNKVCSFKKTTATKSKRSSETNVKTSSSKVSNKSTRRSSKVITYSLSDLEANKKES